MNDNSIRMGIDIGGTFTDIALDVAGTISSTKVLTTHDAPEKAILEGLLATCHKAGIQPSQLTRIIHGTTLATNALIERRGAKTALVTTAGFRDVIEMRTESRFEQYDLNLELPAPLLPRERRYTVSERIAADGSVLIPIQRGEVEALADRLAGARYESIAIGFLHAYVNDTHERLVREVFTERLPDTHVSISSDVSPQMREYERFNTTIANAYVKPMMKRYLARLNGALAEHGVNCTVFLMHSGGGIMSLQDAAEYPVRLVESGPAGGAVFAADVARRHGLNKVLSFDMGGTTAKICLIRDSTPKTSRVFEVARSYRFKKGSGMPVSIPVIDMVEIGAGGGSLASVDAMGQIRVGPRSAGSSPGPACYGLGGKQPAVTDADLLLGRLDPDAFAGGSLTLDVDGAEKAIGSILAAKLGMASETAAFGLSEVVDENMANAARVHAVENGEDLSEYTMIAFGGAAPLHAARLCEKLGIKRMLVPPGAGVGSAIGFLRAPFGFETSRSALQRISDFDASSAAAHFSELSSEATRFVRSCDPSGVIDVAYRVWMRYAGQGWEIPIDMDESLANAPDAVTCQRLFEARYEVLFGRPVEGLDIEITTWSVNASTSLSNSAAIEPVESLEHGDGAPCRRLFDPALGQIVDAAVIERELMPAGAMVTGPAVVTEAETTIIVPSSSDVQRLADGCLDIVRRREHKTESLSGSRDVAHQVMWNRLISVVEEQAQALVRTAFSTSVREAGDLSAGIYDANGAMLAQAVTGTPGHVNAMADAVAHFMRRIGRDQMHEGDVYMTNDPWEGTGHLHDITVVTPSFRQGRLIGFFGCTAHIVDIGGRGFGADADSIYEEGLYLPIMKLADRGTLDATLIKLIRANVRQPDQLIGDVHALATCNEIGHRRLIDMLDEFGLDDLESIARFILNSSREATLELIASLPRKRATGAMTIDGYTRPVTLKVALEAFHDRLCCDFTGTSGVDPKGINVPLVYTKAYACYALKCAIAPEIPNNAASLAPFEITAPEGCILNARHPAPVALRHVIGHMVPDAVYMALDRILPDTVPAEGAGTLCNFQMSLRACASSTSVASPSRAEVLTFNSGGSGARPAHDGLNTTAFPSGVMTMPVEATEQTGPVIIWRKELRPDSGGAGKCRGGLGQFMDVGARSGYEFDFSAMFDRVDHPARGRRAGENGAAMTVAFDDGAPMQGKGKQFVAEGRRVMLAMPGGGGYGAVDERTQAAVRRDLARGYISATAAKEVYGLSAEVIAAVEKGLVEGELVE